MKAHKPVKASKTTPEITTILKMPREPKPESNNLGEILGLKPEAERRDSAPPTPEPPTPPSKANTPQADQTSADRAATLTPMPEPSSMVRTIPGVTIRADVLTYGPDYHRARIRIITPTERYYKLVPGVRTATKAEALTAAQQYREAILASGELPPKGERPPKDTATPKTATPKPPQQPTGLVGVTRVEVD